MIPDPTSRLYARLIHPELRLGLGLGLPPGGNGVPALDLSFVNGETLDGRITFTRGSSGTRVNASGAIETIDSGEPRFDYDPVTLAPLGLLIEEQRTNLLLRSEEFDNSSWTKTNSTITANATTAPDGSSNADSFLANGGATSHFISQNITKAASSITYTRSIYAKQNAWPFVILYADDTAGNSVRVPFDLDAGTAGSASTAGTGFTATSQITDAGDGWYRCQLIVTTNTATIIRCIAYTSDNSAPTSNGTGAEGVYIWGDQLEVGAFATSYIPTTSAQVTRSADVASMTVTAFSNWFNASEGTFVVGGDTCASGTRTLLAADDNTADEMIRLRTVFADPKFTVTDGGTDQCDIDAGSVSANTAFNIAVRYKADDFAASKDGGAAATDTAGTLPTVDRLRIGVDQAGNYANGHIKSLRYYRTALPDATLASLTK